MEAIDAFIASWPMSVSVKEPMVAIYAASFCSTEEADFRALGEDLDFSAANSFACVSIRGAMPLHIRWIWDRLTPAFVANSVTPKPARCIAVRSQVGS